MCQYWSKRGTRSAAMKWCESATPTSSTFPPPSEPCTAEQRWCKRHPPRSPDHVNKSIEILALVLYVVYTKIRYRKNIVALNGCDVGWSHWILCINWIILCCLLYYFDWIYCDILFHIIKLFIYHISVRVIVTYLLLLQNCLCNCILCVHSL